MKARELDEKFDAGEDVTRFLDLKRARRLSHEQKRVNVDFPIWMLESLNREAKRLGVPRQALIKMWIADRLERPERSHPAASRGVTEPPRGD